MTSIFERAAYKAAQTVASRAKIPSGVAKNLPLARSLMRGDVQGALAGLLSRLDEDDAASSSAAARPAPPSLIGGLSVSKVREIYQQVSGIGHAKKNLWFLRITDVAPGDGDLTDFNLFATDVSYSPCTLAGEPVRIGSQSFDNVQGAERVDLQLTTLDDSKGSLKRWFEERHERIAHRDGTFGVPSEYLIRIEILHAFVSPDAQGAGAGKWDKFIMRPVAIQYEKTRREDALDELQMSFTEFDTFTTIK